MVMPHTRALIRSQKDMTLTTILAMPGLALLITTNQLEEVVPEWEAAGEQYEFEEHGGATLTYYRKRRRSSCIADARPMEIGAD